MFSNSAQRLSQEEERRLFIEAGSGLGSARDKLIESNVRLVRKTMSLFNYDAGEEEDIFSTGILGLIYAVDSFDYTRGVMFSTYAIKCIKNTILRDYYRQKKKHAGVISLDELAYRSETDDDVYLIDTISSDDDTYYVAEQVITLKEVMDVVYNKLTTTERYIILSRYGHDRIKSRNQDEIANEIGITRSGVAHAERRAVEKIRKELERCGQYI